MSELTREQVATIFHKVWNREDEQGVEERRVQDFIQAQRQRIEQLEKELESHAWSISPAMAQAKIDQLNQQLAAIRDTVGETEFSLRQQLAAMTAELEEYRSIAETIGAEKAVSQLATMTADRDEANRKLREVCMAHGPALLEIHDLKQERDRLRARLRVIEMGGSCGPEEG